MDTIVQDLHHAKTSHPHSHVLAVTAKPYWAPAAGWQPASCGILVSCLNVNGTAVRKAIYHGRQKCTMRVFMLEILGNRSNCWEKQLFVLDTATLQPTAELASDVLYQVFGVDPVSRQTNRCAQPQCLCLLTVYLVHVFITFVTVALQTGILTCAVHPDTTTSSCRASCLGAIPGSVGLHAGLDTG